MDDDELWAPAPARVTPSIDLGLPGYTDVREIARGGDSVVYRARQAALHRDVAIKVLLEADPATTARFARELEITVRLGRQHPHIVSVLDTATTAQGHPCLVMDFYDLGSLFDRLRSHGPLPVAEVVAAGTDVADALRFAHTHGVLHRDVKPQNILVLPTSYVLTDFGIARMADAGHTASLERFSYRHASPQVLDGLEPTASDDVWSLGSTLFTLLDGRAPFAAPDPADDTALGYLRRVRVGQRRSVARDDVPVGFLAIVESCLAPAREDRPRSADAVHAALLALPTETRSWSPEPAAVVAASATPVRGTPRAPTPGRRERVAPTVPPPITSPAVAPPPVEPPPVALPAIELPPVQPEDDRSLAPSALSLLSTPPPVVPTDDEDTGARPWPAPPAGTSTSRADGEPSARRRRGWVPVVGFMGGAVLLGSAVGVGVTVWTASNRTTPPVVAPEPAATEFDVPVHDEPLPTEAVPVQAEVSDPTMVATDLGYVDNGTSIELSWTDPSEGTAHFVVVDATGKAVRQAAPGVTEVTIEGVDPQAAPLYFRVLAIDPADPDNRKGLSEAVPVRVDPPDTVGSPP